MTDQIQTAYIKQFSSNVFFTAQQKLSVFRNRVRVESVHSKASFFDSIGSTAALRKTGRHADTPFVEVPHGRRMLTVVDYNWATLVDKSDLIRMLQDPTSMYAQAAAFAMARAIDSVIIAAALGTAYAGEEGTDSVSMANANKLAAFDGSATTGCNLNVDTLIKAKEYFELGNIDPNVRKLFAISPRQLSSMLGQTEITNSDYAAVKALVQGEVNTYMGFEFVRSNLLLQTASTFSYEPATGEYGTGSGTFPTSARRCFAWVQDGIILGIGADVRAEVGPRADKNYETQIYAEMSIGGTRMEEAKVLEVLCKE